MTDKELRKLRRDDLLQILIDQQRQNDELKAALEEAKKALEDRRIKLNESGSIAEAALRINGVFEAAQSAADQYTAQMREEAEELRARAQADMDKAKVTADDIVHSARGEAERILREARGEAERLKAEAAGRPAPLAPEEAAQPTEEKHRKGLLWRNRKA